MSFTQQYTFTTPLNYTFNTNLIEISGTGKLKLINNPGQDFTETFDSDTGFTYDSLNAEFIGGQVQQKNKRPSNAVFYASYTNDKNGSWGDGTLTGTLGGSASVHDGYLDLYSGGYEEFPVDNFVSMTGNAGCIRKRISFDYTGAAPAIQYIIQTSPNTLNRVYLAHNDIYLQCYIFNNVGALTYNMTFGWTPIQGNIYEIEINWTSTNAYIFINGQLKDSDTGSLSINKPTLFRLGADSNTKIRIYDILVYNTLQHNSNYTPNWSNIYEYDYLGSNVILPEMEYTGAGTLISFDVFTTTETDTPRYILQIGRSGNYLYWNGSAWATSDETYLQANDFTTFAANISSLPVNGEIYGQFQIIFQDSNTQSDVAELTASLTAQIYSLTNPTITPITGINTEGLISFSSVVVEPGNDTVTFTIDVSGTQKYWNGSAWVNSSGYPQTNTISDINANIASLDLTGGQSVNFVTYLHSNDGITTPEIDSIIVIYDFHAPDATAPTKCVVYDYIYNDVPVKNVVVTAKLTEYSIYNNELQMAKKVYSTISDLDGYWELELPENDSMVPESGYTFTFKGDNIDFSKDKVVPNESTKPYSELANL